MNSQAFVRLRRALTVALILTVLVVVAGATVRATGAGMGCPDWPLCFGCLVPPVSADQLPPDFAQKYAVDGHPAVFDAVKTWIEYTNRLLGVLAGLGLVVTTVFTAFVVRRKPSLAVLNGLSLVTLGFVAWLGARVVGTFLAPYSVTLHLVASFFLVGLLLAQREIVVRAVGTARPAATRFLVGVLVFLGLTFFFQGALGIRVRDESESWLWNQNLADSLFNAWGGAYDLHKIHAGLVALTASVLAWLGWRRRSQDPQLTRLTLAIAGCVAAQALVGLVLWLGGLPAWAKPLHLLAFTGAWSFWLAAVFHLVPGRAPRV